MELQAKRALARLVEAYADLKAARTLVKSLESRSLFHSQQCVEKALKACLSKVVVGEIMIHPVVKLLHLKILPTLDARLQEHFLEIEKEAFWVERRWIDTRYEEVGVKGEIIIPLLKFQPADAIRGVEIASKTLSWSTDCVNKTFGMKFPKSYLKLRELARKELV